MDFDLTSEQGLLQETVYKWAVNEWGPLRERIDEEDWTPGPFSQTGRNGAFGYYRRP